MRNAEINFLFQRAKHKLKFSILIRDKILLARNIAPTIYTAESLLHLVDVYIGVAIGGKVLREVTIRLREEVILCLSIW